MREATRRPLGARPTSHTREAMALLTRLACNLPPHPQLMMFASLLALLGVRVPGRYLVRQWHPRVAPQNVTACNGTVVLGFARSDHLQDTSIGERCLPMQHCLLNWEAVRQYDTLVLNRGVHIVPDATLARQTRQLATRLRDRNGHQRIIWRTTVPGHENCTVASQPLRAYHVPPGHRYGWDQVERQNDLIFRRGAPPTVYPEARTPSQNPGA